MQMKKLPGHRDKKPNWGEGPRVAIRETPYLHRHQEDSTPSGHYSGHEIGKAGKK